MTLFPLYRIIVVKIGKRAHYDEKISQENCMSSLEKTFDTPMNQLENKHFNTKV